MVESTRELNIGELESHRRPRGTMLSPIRIIIIVGAIPCSTKPDLSDIQER